MLFRILAAIFILTALTLTYKQKRAGRMRQSVFIAGVCLWLAGAVVIAIPDLASSAAFYLGIGRGVDLVLYGALALGTLFIFSLSARLYKIERDISYLVKILALKENHKSEAAEEKNQKPLL